MAAFLYRGRNSRGERIEGRLEAAGLQAALSLLATQNITPLTLSEAQSAAGEQRKPAIFKPAVALEELLMFCRQMHSMSKAGVPVVQAIRTLAASNRSDKLREDLQGCASSLESGKNLSTSFSLYPETFSPLFINMMHVGENTGRLDDAFRELGNYLQMERETRKRLQQATRYPSFVLIVIAGAILLMNFMVIPTFAKVFAKFQVELPLPTRLLIGTSDFLIHYGGWLAGLLLLGFFIWRRYVHTEEGRYHRDRWRLQLPIVGRIFQRLVLSRFARCMAMMLRAGVPVIQTLNITSRALNNEYVGQAVRRMAVAIERGDTITRSASATGLFTPLVLQMLLVGEESGTLDEMLAEVADFYDSEVDYDLKLLADRLEPLLIIAIGVVVLILALGIFLPLWNLNTVFNK